MANNTITNVTGNTIPQNNSQNTSQKEDLLIKGGLTKAEEEELYSLSDLDADALTTEQSERFGELFIKGLEGKSSPGNFFEHKREMFIKANGDIYDSRQWDDLQAGDVVKFGLALRGEKVPLNIENTKNERTLTDIYWKVLEVKAGKALLITDKLYFRTMDPDSIGKTPSWQSSRMKSDIWKTSMYRQACQNFYGVVDQECNLHDLFDDAFIMVPWFSYEERDCIIETEIESKADDGRAACKTKDHLFLLSVDEYKKYFEASDKPTIKVYYGSDDYVKVPTYEAPKAACDYCDFYLNEVVSDSVFHYAEKEYWHDYYYLRDIAKNGHNFGVNVAKGTLVADRGYLPSRSRWGMIRPAMWVDIEACKKLKIEVI